jgi:hypothetical protein
MKSVAAVAFFLALAVAQEDSVTLVDFSTGESGTSWVAENDPVMGGVSNSNITIQTDRLAWDGEVKSRTTD